MGVFLGILCVSGSPVASDEQIQAKSLMSTCCSLAADTTKESEYRCPFLKNCIKRFSVSAAENKR